MLRDYLADERGVGAATRAPRYPLSHEAILRESVDVICWQPPLAVAIPVGSQPRPWARIRTASVQMPLGK